MKRIAVLLFVLSAVLMAVTYAEDDKLPKKGVISGEVVKVQDAKFKVKVTDTSKCCKVLQGETMEFCCRQAKTKCGKCVPCPKQVKLFAKLSVGDTVKVVFYRSKELWRVKKLKIVKKAQKKDHGRSRR